MAPHINAAQRRALWVLNKACTSSGSLQHASAVSALLCSTMGTAPGEPIKNGRCAGDSCSGSYPPKASELDITDGEIL